MGNHAGVEDTHQNDRRSSLIRLKIPEDLSECEFPVCAFRPQACLCRCLTFEVVVCDPQQLSGLGLF